MIQSYRPETLKEALQIRNQIDCTVFAGGTDLYIRKRQWQGAERRFDNDLLFIHQLSELRKIEVSDEEIILGACVTQSEIEGDAYLPEFLRMPYRLMGNPAIRNTATVGGNIVNAAQVADSLPVLFALDSQVVLQSIHGERKMPTMDFVIGKYKTGIQTNEILTHVMIPKKNWTDFYYRKIGSRKQNILSKLSVIVLLEKKNDDLTNLAISIGCVNEKPIRDHEIEQGFLESGAINQLIDQLYDKMEGQNDKRSSKAYREITSLKLIKDYLEKNS